MSASASSRLFEPGRLAAFRRERGMSQYELAKAIGCTVQSVSNWESGRNQPSLRMLQQMYDVLGVRASFDGGGRA